MENLIEKAVGRARKAAGDLADDSPLRRGGARDEKRAEVNGNLGSARETLAQKAREVAHLEKKT